MAEKRMFSKQIIDSDAFIDMPTSARLLYFDLAMRADDDGFVNSPKKIMRMTGASQDDLSILGIKKFIIPFDSGVVVIKHWKIHNYIQSDRYHETTYLEEKALLSEDENKAYTMRSDDQIPAEQPKSLPQSNRSTNKKSIMVLVNEFTENEDLRKALSDFCDMRKEIKKPLTPRAMEMVLAKLKKLSIEEKEQIEIVNTSTERCWQTVYPLKKAMTVSSNCGETDFDELRRRDKAHKENLRQLAMKMGIET